MKTNQNNSPVKTVYFAAAIPAALAVAIQTAAAQTWQTVDDFQYVAGQPAVNQGLVATPSGIVYACGFADDGLSTNSTHERHGLVMASADGGNTWSAPLDDFFSPSVDVRFDSITADSAGNLYVSGRSYSAPPYHQFVRRSTDGGATWRTVDDATGGAPADTINAEHITADTSGNVYVIGKAVNTWSIRKGIGGTNYSTVDTFQPSASQAWAVFAHPTAGIFAVGQGTITVTSKHSISTSVGWFVRRSLDGGATWATVDAYQASSGYSAMAHAVGADAHGNIYVMGAAFVSSGKSSIAHWLVRKSADNGASWTIVDDYAGSEGGNALGFAADANGNLFVVGDGPLGWTVRESAGGTGPWTTVDATTVGGVHAITADHLGNVFVGGGGVEWIVRKN